EWAGLQAVGQVQLHNPSDDARRIEKRGAGVGPVTLSFLMALIFALAVVYVLEYIDTRVKSEYDVRRYLGLPLLGVIPNQKNHLITGDEVQGEVAEKFNTAATLIRSTSRELGMRSFIVSSAVAREGKTTVSVNLAAALARKGARVVLVDGDLRAPKIHEILGLSNRTGLSTILETRLDSRRVIEEGLPDPRQSESALGTAEALSASGVENLSVLTSGPPADSPIQLLESDRMHRLIKELSASADFVILDTPPVNVFGDALTMAGMADGCIFVVGSGLCHQHEVAWAKHLLGNVQANLLGVFLNRYAHKTSSDSYYYYYRSGSDRRKRVKAVV
ncbi:MAG: polysaccharide biosynthesis tyrosine autokinase, partial [Gemmatimonadales bacterium]